MIDTEWIDGVAYHAQPRYLVNSDGEVVEGFDGEPVVEYMELITDCNGDPYPKSVCICAAHNGSECCCGAYDNRDDY